MRFWLPIDIVVAYLMVSIPFSEVCVCVCAANTLVSHSCFALRMAVRLFLVHKPKSLKVRLTGGKRSQSGAKVFVAATGFLLKLLTLRVGVRRCLLQSIVSISLLHFGQAESNARM